MDAAYLCPKCKKGMVKILYTRPDEPGHPKYMWGHLYELAEILNKTVCENSIRGLTGRPAGGGNRRVRER